MASPRNEYDMSGTPPSHLLDPGFNGISDSLFPGSAQTSSSLYGRPTADSERHHSAHLSTVELTQSGLEATSRDTMQTDIPFNEVNQISYLVCDLRHPKPGGAMAIVNEQMSSAKVNFEELNRIATADFSEGGLPSRKKSMQSLLKWFWVYAMWPCSYMLSIFEKDTRLPGVPDHAGAIQSSNSDT